MPSPIRAAALASLLLLPACNLPPADVGAIVHGALTFACTTVAPFVPAADRSLANVVCTNAGIGVDVITKIIDDAANARAAGPRLVQPQGEARPVPVTCAGGVVASVDARVAAKVQAALNERGECRR